MISELHALAKPLVIIGGGVHQLPYVKYCQDQNIPTIVFDKNEEAIAGEVSDIFLSVDTSNVSKMIQEIERNTTTCGIGGVLVAGVELAVVGARISKHFNTKSVDVNTAMNATNKIIRAKRLKESGIPQPTFEIVDSIHSVSMGIPYVIKEQEGSGSRGVRVITSELDKLHAVECYAGGGNSRYLVEEFVEGHEISIEAFIHKGEFFYYCFAIRDIELMPDGKIIEHGSISDPTCDTVMVREVKKEFENACNALGIDAGPAKGDVLYTISGPSILEVASRSAPLAPLISDRVYGVDMISTHINWVLDPDFSFNSMPIEFSKSKPVCHRILLHEPGTLTDISGVDEAKKGNGVLEIIMLRELNFPMTLDSPNNGNRILYVAATGADAAQAIINADNALSKINLVYK
jgi:biotin carboxylase